jgi:P27 family predicted phage terminase small subunit
MKANRGRAVVGEPELEPIPAPDVIAADPAALAEWDALAEGLRRLGVLTRESVGLLAAYCLAWSDVKKARAAILKAGPDADALVETNKGGTRRRTCYNIVRERTADACRCLDMLGVAPVARSRLKLVEKAPPTENDLRLRELMYKPERN